MYNHPPGDPSTGGWWIVYAQRKRLYAGAAFGHIFAIGSPAISEMTIPPAPPSQARTRGGNTANLSLAALARRGEGRGRGGRGGVRPFEKAPRLMGRARLPPTQDRERGYF